MKKIDKYITEKVENTLQAFDGIERAKIKPFLYTRLQARLEKKAIQSIETGMLSPAFQRFAVIMIMTVIVFNIYTATRFFINSSTDASLSTSEQLFIEEYYPSTPTLYNISQTLSNP
ncbi:MAG: hypothetical protein KFF73_11480 [Cyclobacteriaceae bacterium]|nr:hypothetical protein [Cyclobacteriaceae bacterium]